MYHRKQTKGVLFNPEDCRGALTEIAAGANLCTECVKEPKGLLPLLFEREREREKEGGGT